MNADRIVIGGTDVTDAIDQQYPGVEPSIAHDAIRIADERVEDLAANAYHAVQGRLDEIVATVASDNDFRTTATAGSRRTVVERLLIGLTSGFVPPAHLRDEIATRAHRAARLASNARNLWMRVGRDTLPTSPGPGIE